MVSTSDFPIMPTDWADVEVDQPLTRGVIVAPISSTL